MAKKPKQEESEKAEEKSLNAEERLLEAWDKLEKRLEKRGLLAALEE